MATQENSQDNGVQIRVQDPTKPPLIYVDIVEESLSFTYKGIEDALILTFHRTIRVPDNHGSISALPPNLGEFPIYKVQDYAEQVPADVAKKSGLFFTMYQREAMWINFRAILPFAIRVFVGGINAVSGFPKEERAEQARKDAAMHENGGPVQDYMVVPGQPWLDGIVCEDGKVRQFVAQPRGSGFSVEQQITGKDDTGGIQIEIIPIKCGSLPEYLDVYFKDQGREDKRRLNLVEKGLEESSTWKQLKEVLKHEFGIPVSEQVLSPQVEWNYYLPINDDAKISEYYFKSGFVLRVSRDPGHAAAPFRGPVGPRAYSAMTGAPPSYRSIENRMQEMSMAAGGLINQNIRRDKNPPSSWDKDAAILFHVHILDTATFAAVTGKPAPATPISARTYAEHGSYFFEIWGEEPTGIKGDFAKVKSIAALEEERAEEEGIPYQAEEFVPQRISVIGGYKSTFVPVGMDVTRGLAYRPRRRRS
ncbi:hypothetical protein F4859DRAFT_527057 [Xylaria cf. heliscus]|nr:hypothetical protein F4859DRAFT_527057 [Xylaria cf. heliscus]